MPNVDSRALIRKVAWRIVPLVFLLYIVAYLDRANVGFAKLRMQSDLQFSDSVFGWGIGIFFAGYLLLEIPGAILVERWSARKWFARILLSWGVCSMAMAFVKTPTQFYVLRFMLGLAEAGFFPGVIVYFTHWFPRAQRGRAFAGLVLAVPVSLALGARVSGWLLRVEWLELAGWQWVFLLEGLPAVPLGLIVPFLLTDRPKDARWLTNDERDWLDQTLAAERAESQALGSEKIGQVLRRPTAWLLAAGIFFTNMGGYAMVFWLPTVIKNLLIDMELKSTESAVLNWASLVYLAGLAGVWLSGWSSDRFRERKWHCFVGQAGTAVFLVASIIPGQPWALVLVWLCVMGFFAFWWPSPFWALPTQTLPAGALAVSIGFINMCANASGGLGNPIVGQMKEAGLGDRACLAFLAACYLLGGLIIALVRVPALRPAEKPNP